MLRIVSLAFIVLSLLLAGCDRQDKKEVTEKESTEQQSVQDSTAADTTINNGDNIY